MSFLEWKSQVPGGLQAQNTQVSDSISLIIVLLPSMDVVSWLEFLVVAAGGQWQLQHLPCRSQQERSGLLLLS